MSLCPNGHEVDEGSDYCHKCGAKLSGAGMAPAHGSAAISPRQVPNYTVTIKGQLDHRGKQLAAKLLIQLTERNYAAILSVFGRYPEILLGKKFTKDIAYEIKKQIEPLGVIIEVTPTTTLQSENATRPRRHNFN